MRVGLSRLLDTLCVNCKYQGVNQPTKPWASVPYFNIQKIRHKFMSVKKGNLITTKSCQIQDICGYFCLTMLHLRSQKSCTQ